MWSGLHHSSVVSAPGINGHRGFLMILYHQRELLCTYTTWEKYSEIATCCYSYPNRILVPEFLVKCRVRLCISTEHTYIYALFSFKWWDYIIRSTLFYSLITFVSILSNTIKSMLHFVWCKHAKFVLYSCQVHFDLWFKFLHFVHISFYLFE